MEQIRLNTSDQYPITLTRFAENQHENKIILISPATGIQQSFYRDYAKFLAQNGYIVYTYDYRGIGLSKPEDGLKGFEASMRDWAIKDFTSVTDYLCKTYPDAKKYHIGHSIGGIFVGLTKAYSAYNGMITIAAQFAYWRYFEFKYLLGVLWLFYVVIPLSCYFMGYFPSKIKQLGQPLPKGAALDWKTLLTSPDSILALAEQSENYYADIKLPMLLISIEDDWMATKKAVDKMAEKVFIHAQTERKHILLKDSNTKSIGHVGFFRKKFKTTLWQIPLDWFEGISSKN